MSNPFNDREQLTIGDRLRRRPLPNESSQYAVSAGTRYIWKKAVLSPPPLLLSYIYICWSLPRPLLSIPSCIRKNKTYSCYICAMLYVHLPMLDHRGMFSFKTSFYRYTLASGFFVPADSKFMFINSCCVFCDYGLPPCRSS